MCLVLRYYGLGNALPLAPPGLQRHAHPVCGTACAWAGGVCALLVHLLDPAVLSLSRSICSERFGALVVSAALGGVDALVVHLLGPVVVGLWFSSAIGNRSLTCRTAPARRQ